MNIFTKAGLLVHIAKWRLTWDKKDLDYKPKNVSNPKFMSARQAVELINDGDVVATNGMAGNMRCSIFYWAVKDRFLKTGHPANLTWIGVGGIGGRGRVPGTIEEVGIKGLVTRLIAGHLETMKSLLKLAQSGDLQMHNMTQGQMAFAIEAQGRGEPYVKSDTAVGTYMDPRVGKGSCIATTTDESLITVDGNELRFSLPPIKVAMFVGSAADEEGNIYMQHVPMYTEAPDIAYAAKKNGGKVAVAVAEIIPKDEKNIFLSKDYVDAIVVNPENEQVGSVPQRKYWKMFDVGWNVDTDDAVEKLKFVNNVLGITPYRGPVENALARLAASLFTKNVVKGAHVNIGVGMPEEVSRLLYEGGLYKDVTFMTETGVFGGLPTMGIFFGSAINPQKLMTSAQMFRFYYDHLHCSCLGLLQADEEGNINVSKRGEGPVNYVGCGGLPDIAAAAKTIVFVGSWMAHAQMSVEDGKLKITKPGKLKFVKKVDEITFSGKEAMRKGKNVFYATNVGVFQLTPQGMMLIQVMPGIDVKKDILDVCEMKIILPPDGNVPMVDRAIVTGEGFKLEWGK